MIKLFIHRHRDGSGEEIADFKYGDLADVAAIAICERLHVPVSVQNVQDNGNFSRRFEWGKKSVDTVVETEWQPIKDRT